MKKTSFVLIVVALLASGFLSCEIKKNYVKQDKNGEYFKYSLSDLDQPITATTVKECIEEIQCAWDYFRHLAFGSDLGMEGVEESRVERIRKYTGEHYPIIAHNKDYQLYFDHIIPVVEEIFPKIRKSIRRNIHVNAPINPLPNIVIIHDNDPDLGLSEKNKRVFKGIPNLGKGWFERQLKDIRKHSGTDTFAIINANDDFSINGSIVFIKKYKNESHIKGGLIEEIIQSTGLMNDYQDAPFTIFNDVDDGRLWPTELDWLLLAILYHDDVKLGMTPEEAKKVFPIAYRDSKILLETEEAKL